MQNACAQATAAMSFLVVDDSNSMRRIIMRTIKAMGCGPLFEAEDGKAAQELLDAKPVDFIVSDWNMPRMNGLQLLRYVRATPWGRDTPFLMVSAESKAEDIVEAIHSGVSNYLPKPFTPELLRKKIEVILQARLEACRP